MNYSLGIYMEIIIAAFKGKLLYCCRSKPKIASKLDQLNLKKCDFYYIGPMEEDLQAYTLI